MLLLLLSNNVLILCKGTCLSMQKLWCGGIHQCCGWFRFHFKVGFMEDIYFVESEEFHQRRGYSHLIFPLLLHIPRRERHNHFCPFLSLSFVLWDIKAFYLCKFIPQKNQNKINNINISLSILAKQFTKSFFFFLFFLFSFLFFNTNLHHYTILHISQWITPKKNE